MAFIRLPGTAQRYADTETGETISRRQYEKIARPTQIAAREQRYRVEVQERRAAISFIPRTRMDENKAYWRQRYAEQYAVRHNIDDREAKRITFQPGSEFNRLWAQAERQGFDGGEGSAWDALAYRAGAKGGAENEAERSKYLAVIAWYMRNDYVGAERWVDRGAKGQFDWPGYKAS